MGRFQNVFVFLLKLLNPLLKVLLLSKWSPAPFVTPQFCRLKSICDTLFRKCQGKTFVIWVMLKVCWKYNHSYINFGHILWPISFVHDCKEVFLIFVVLLSPLLCKGEEKSISSSIIPSVSLKVAKNKEEEQK